MQIADAATLPNIIEFNVSVVATSTTVYNVILTAGSAVLTIVGTDIANSTDLTVTDNSLLKWTRAILRKSQGTEYWLS